MNNETMENRIREIRQSRGLTMKEVGILANTTEVQIYRLEKEKVALDIYWMERLAKALNVKPYELLPREWQPETVETSSSSMNWQLIANLFDTLDYFLKSEKITMEETDRLKLIQFLYETKVSKDNIVPTIRIWQVANPSIFRKTG